MIRVEPATLSWLEALTEGDDAFAAQFGTSVVPGWAPIAEAISFALRTARSGAPAAWGVHLIFDDDGALVGNGGWKGPPVNGVAELGYAVAPDRQRQGIATATVHELVARARIAGVQVVVAHTLPEPSASTTVLQRCGFVCVGELVNGDHGIVWRWELPVANPDN